MEKLVSVGDKVRLARESKYPPWSQYDIAKLSGVSRDKIASWESGRSAPKPADLRKVAAALQVPYPWFHDGEPTPAPFFIAQDPAGNVASEPDAKYAAPSRNLRAIPNRRIKIYGAISAGDGSTATLDPDEFDFPDQLVRDDYSAMIIEGESMAPFLEPSDIAIFCDWTVPKPGHVFAAHVSDESPGWVVKLLAKAKDGRYVLRSLNDKTVRPDITAEFRLGGYLVGIVRDNGNERTIRLNPWGLIPPEDLTRNLKA